MPPDQSQETQESQELQTQPVQDQPPASPAQPEAADPSQPTQDEPKTLLEAIEKELGQTDEDQPAKEGSDPKEAGNPEKGEDKPDTDTAGDDPAKLNFKELRTHYETLKSEHQDTRQQLDDLRGLIQDSGAEPQEFLDALDYIRDIKSGNLEAAAQRLQAQAKLLSLALGRPILEASPLEDFPDLKSAVENLEITEAAAMELARSRTAAKRIQQQQQERQTQEQSSAEMVKARQQALSQIDALAAQWAATDIDYKRKEAVLLKRLEPIAKQYPPAMWAGQIKMLYEALGEVSPAAAAPAGGGQRPLRAAGGGGRQAPKSTLEQIDQTLGYA